MTTADDNRARPVADLWAAELVDEFARCGLRHCCISPGSRSTPLVVQIDDHSDIEDVTILDERSAAFYALGLARATDRPVGLVCTSGTAAANWMPAVCEADRAGVPLLLMTADRPPRLRDTGSPQSMDQLKLFGDRVRWFHAFGLPRAQADAFRSLLSRVDLAWERARRPTPGPVHLNLAFRKPLEPLSLDPDHRDAVRPDFEPPSRLDGEPDAGFCTGVRSPKPAQVDRLEEQFSRAERPLFLCGADRHGTRYRRALRDLAASVDAPVLAEPTSQLRYWTENGDVIGVGDYLVDSDLYQRAGAPDLVVRTGEAPLTWAGRRFVQEQRRARQIAIQPNVRRRDPDHVVDRHFVGDEARLFDACRKQFDDGTEADTAWLDAHRSAARAARRALEATLTTPEVLEEPRMWWELQGLLPSPASMFISNSMPIRNVDMYAPGGTGEIDVYFNRGLNGIDGIASTGLGVAAGTDSPTVVVTGDVAFRHDVGGLAVARRTGADVTILVVDNGGGAIFDKLPIAECGDVHKRQFVTELELDISRVGEGFEIPVASPESWDAFRRETTDAIAADDVQIVHLRTDRTRDHRRADEIRARVVDAIGEM